MLFSTLRVVFQITPVSSRITATVTTTTLTNRASGFGMKRSMNPVSQPATRRSPRAICRTSNPTTIAIRMTSAPWPPATVGMPKSTRIWFCHTTPRITNKTISTAATTANTHPAMRAPRRLQCTVNPSLTTNHSSRTPKPYPATTQSPVITPW